MKKCSKCKDIKDLSCFFKTRLSKDGLNSWCKVCHKKVIDAYRIKNPDRAKERVSKWRERNPGGKYKIYWPGVTAAVAWENYCTILKVQEHSCAICGVKDVLLKSPLEVDHSHTTGKVRGLLCLTCNSGIGHLRDSAENCAKASEYLKKHQ